MACPKNEGPKFLLSTELRASCDVWCLRIVQKHLPKKLRKLFAKQRNTIDLIGRSCQQQIKITTPSRCYPLRVEHMIVAQTHKQYRARLHVLLEKVLKVCFTKDRERQQRVVRWVVTNKIVTQYASPQFYLLEVSLPRDLWFDFMKAVGGELKEDDPRDLPSLLSLYQCPGQNRRCFCGNPGPGRY